MATEVKITPTIIRGATLGQVDVEVRVNHGKFSWVDYANGVLPEEALDRAGYLEAGIRGITGWGEK